VNRRDFCTAMPLLLAGCGASEGDMGREFELQQSPQLRTAKSVFGGGVQGLWTPTLSFSTPGDLSVTYGNQLGIYLRFGSMVWVTGTVTASPFTHTTASGSLRINGLPFTVVNNSSMVCTGSININGITAASHEWAIVYAVINNKRCHIRLCAFGGAIDTDVDETHATSGTVKQLEFSLWYVTSDAA